MRCGDDLIFHGSINTPNAVQPNAASHGHRERRSTGDRLWALLTPRSRSAQAEGPSGSKATRLGTGCPHLSPGAGVQRCGAQGDTATLHRCQEPGHSAAGALLPPPHPQPVLQGLCHVDRRVQGVASPGPAPSSSSKFTV